VVGQSAPHLFVFVYHKQRVHSALRRTATKAITDARGSIDYSNKQRYRRLNPFNPNPDADVRRYKNERTRPGADHSLAGLVPVLSPIDAEPLDVGRRSEKNLNGFFSPLARSGANAFASLPSLSLSCSS